MYVLFIHLCLLHVHVLHSNEKDKVELLRKCISSIEEKSAGTRYEIIVIDNGSKDINTFYYFRSFLVQLFLNFSNPSSSFKLISKL